jgi:SAM-dependent methyltransferase
MINDLVNNLPELYQPIYGHDELTLTPSRPCFDRFNEIRQIYNSFARLLNRPLKVLDLGCAQGYFAFSLAKEGAIVTGIDHLKENIVLCNALAVENPELSISFSHVRIEEFVDHLSPNQYDLILGLSVFHHLIHNNGIPQVKSILKRLADLSRVMLLEFASRSEPCYWGPTQPDDPRTLIDEISFTHLIANYPTHLSDVYRPLFVASNSYCVLGDKVVKFDNWSFESHALSKSSHKFSRRYYFNNEEIVKLYRLDHSRGIYNETEHRREADFLRSPANGFRCTRLITAGSNNSESWICIERLPGKLLLDLILNGEDYDAHRVILDILEQLSFLESAQLYHNDVRAWNVLVDKDNDLVYLIDYGSISAEPRDCSWPDNLFLAFFIFLNEVATGCVFDSVHRTTPISPTGLPELYQAWASSLWERPINDWSFKLMYETLKSNSDDARRSSSQLLPMSFWMSAIERELQNLSKFFDYLISSSTQRMVTRVVQAEALAQSAETHVVQAATIAQSAETRAVQAEAIARSAETRAVQAEVNAETRAVQAEAIARSAETRAVQAEVIAETRAVQAEAIARSAETRAVQAEALAETRAVQAEAIVETRAGQAEAIAQLAELRAVQAEAVAKSAETRGGHAEAIAQAAETRALQAERIAQAAEARAVKAEAIMQSAEIRAVQAEAVAQSAEMRAVQAEAIAQSAESSGGQAEVIAQSAEMRAVRAEANAQAAETRAAEAEAIAKSAEMRGRQAEVIAQSAEMRAVQAEAIAQSAEMSGEQAESFAQSAELRAVQAETIAQSAELRAIQAEVIAETAETRGRQAEAIAQAAEIRTVQVEAIAQSAETHAVNAETIARHAEARAVQAELIAYQYSMQLQALLATKSWRYTEPLRWFYRKLNIFRDLDPASRIKHLVVKVLRNLNQELLLRPKLRHHLLWLIRQFGIFSTIKKVYGKIKPPSEFSSMASSSQFYEDLSPVNLTPKAHQIYSLLKDAIDEHQK